MEKGAKARVSVVVKLVLVPIICLWTGAHLALATFSDLLLRHKIRFLGDNSAFLSHSGTLKRLVQLQL
jgi:hypothetical protein